MTEMCRIGGVQVRPVETLAARHARTRPIADQPALGSHPSSRCLLVLPGVVLRWAADARRTRLRTESLMGRTKSMADFRPADHAMGLELQLEELIEQRERARVQGRPEDAERLEGQISALHQNSLLLLNSQSEKVLEETPVPSFITPRN
jgi:hypothetical protein